MRALLLAIAITATTIPVFADEPIVVLDVVHYGSFVSAKVRDKQMSDHQVYFVAVGASLDGSIVREITDEHVRLANGRVLIVRRALADGVAATSSICSKSRHSC